jgi:hypothetical protein
VSADFFSGKKTHISSKECHCSLCNQHILKGEKYVARTGKYCNDFFYHKFHLDCDMLITYYINESGEGEYSDDSIRDWLQDKYCYLCDKYDSADCDCPASDVLRCEIIINAEKDVRK